MPNDWLGFEKRRKDTTFFWIGNYSEKKTYFCGQFNTNYHVTKNTIHFLFPLGADVRHAIFSAFR